MDITPETNDVVHGKGFSVNSRPGNKRYRALVVAMKADYEAAPKELKGIFGNQIVHHIYNLNPPGRFLRKDKGTGKWLEVSEKEAAKKARQALRDTKLVSRSRCCDTNTKLAEGLQHLFPSIISKNKTEKTKRTYQPKQSQSQLLRIENKQIEMQSAQHVQLSDDVVLRSLIDENIRLKMKVDRLKTEMDAMLAFNDLVHPSSTATPKTEENEEDIDSDDTSFDEEIASEIYPVDLGLDDSDDLSLLGIDFTTIFEEKPESTAESAPVLRSQGGSKWCRRRHSSAARRASMPGASGVTKHQCYVFGNIKRFFSSLFRKQTLRRKMSNPCAVEKENACLKLRIKTMQNMKKMILKNHDMHVSRQAPLEYAC